MEKRELQEPLPFVKDLISIFPSVKHHLGRYPNYDRIVQDLNGRFPNLCAETSVKNLKETAHSLGRYYGDREPEFHYGYLHPISKLHNKIVIAHDHPMYGDDIYLAATVAHEFGHFLNTNYIPFIRNNPRTEKETRSFKMELIVLADELLAWVWGLSLLFFRYRLRSPGYFFFALRCFNSYCRLSLLPLGVGMFVSPVFYAFCLSKETSFPFLIPVFYLLILSHLLFWKHWWRAVIGI